MTDINCLLNQNDTTIILASSWEMTHPHYNNSMYHIFQFLPTCEFSSESVVNNPANYTEAVGAISMKVLHMNVPNKVR
eukprot:9828062-Ditylum_brightwellii.AAC.1